MNVGLLRLVNRIKACNLMLFHIVSLFQNIDMTVLKAPAEDLTAEELAALEVADMDIIAK